MRFRFASKAACVRGRGAPADRRRPDFTTIVALLAIAATAAAPVAARAQPAGVPDANALAAAVVAYARFAAAHPLDDADARRIADAALGALRARPADAASDRAVAAFMDGVGRLNGPEREAVRAQVWQTFAARARAEGTSLDPITATVLQANPVAASDPRTGVDVSRYAMDKYASSVALENALAGRPRVTDVDMNRLLARMESAFPSYPAEAQRDLADAASLWSGLRARLADGPQSLDALRAQLGGVPSGSPASVAGVEAFARALQTPDAQNAFGRLVSTAQAALAALFRAVPTEGRSGP